MHKRRGSMAAGTVCALVFAVALLLLPSAGTAAELKRMVPDHIANITMDQEDEHISYPISVFSDPVNGEIYVLDAKDRAIIYTPDFFPIFTIGARLGVIGIQSLIVDPQGYVYVAVGPRRDIMQNAIKVLSPRLKWERDIVVTGFADAKDFWPYRMALDSRGTMYVSGYYQRIVAVVDAKSGTTKGTIVVEEGDKHVSINSVAVDKDDNVYLVSEEEGHIYVYDRDLKFLFRFGDKGGSSGKLSRPMAVGIDEERGLLIVSDFMRNTILVYAKKDGKFLFEFGGLGWGDGWFQHQRDLIVDNQGRIIIADTFNNRVQVLKFKD